MTDSTAPAGRDYTDCYRSIRETLENCEGGVAAYDIETIADEGIVEHPSGRGWMIVGSDDPADMGEAFWAVVEDNVWPEDHIQDMAYVLAAEGDWATGDEQPRKVAMEWAETLPDCDAPDVAAWLLAGVFRPEKAAELKAASIDPFDLPNPVGYGYANGDLTLDDVRESLADII